MQLPPESVKLGGLRYLATMYAESATPESEIRREDIMPVLREDIDRRLSNRHLVNIQITGQVTEGKSTLMIQFLLYVLGRLGKPLRLFNIAGDQIEGLRKIANPDVFDTCIGIDEFNKLSTTGLNATTDSAQYDYYSDVQAQKYIHKINCSPATITDNNTDIVLQVVSVDKANERTWFTVAYRLVRPNMEVFFQPVGLASVCVHDALHHPVYADYRKKKFAKMDLVSKEGVRDVRELEHARVTMEVYRLLESLAGVSDISKDTCSVYVKVIRSKYRELFSILTVDDISRDAHALLGMCGDVYALKQRASSVKSRLSDEQRIVLKEESLKLSATLDMALAHYQRLIGVYERYSNI